MKYKTDQENFWANDFGNDYTDRNNSLEMFSSYLKFWSEILRCKNDISSVIEFGANIGVNIMSIKHLLPKAKLCAIEINKKACDRLSKIEGLTVINDSILNFDGGGYDLVFTRGVLIHINPNELQNVYKKMYEGTNKGGYILVDEYFNPTPVEVEYRGNGDRLFKRDFAGELMDEYPDLELVNYGCTYHRDGWNDDSNWFLMKKRQ